MLNIISSRLKSMFAILITIMTVFYSITGQAVVVLSSSTPAYNKVFNLTFPVSTGQNLEADFFQKFILPSGQNFTITTSTTDDSNWYSQNKVIFSTPGAGVNTGKTFNGWPILSTGVPGIGLAVSGFPINDTLVKDTRCNFLDSPQCTIQSTNVAMILVKIGPVDFGQGTALNLDFTLTQTFGTLTSQVTTTTVQVKLNVTLTKTTCAVETVSTPSVKLGDWDINYFKNNTTTDWVDFAINMSGCTSNGNWITSTGTGDGNSWKVIGENTWSISLSPGNPNKVDSTTMRLKEGANTAKGVGIQIKAVDSAFSILEFDKIYTSGDLYGTDYSRSEMAVGENTSVTIPMAARYTTLGASEPLSGGKADATATFIIDYY